MTDDSEPDVTATDELRADEELPRTGIDRLRADEEIYQSADNNPAEYEMGEDGMPKPKTPTNMPFAPPLSPATFICMADTSGFVIRDEWGDVLAEFAPDEVERAPDGRWRVRVGEAESKSEQLGEVAALTLRAIVQVCASRGWIEVKPVRPACKHYARQMTDFQDDDEHAFIARICTARRDTGGEFLSLRDAQTFGCDLRDPPEPVGRARLDKFDDNKIELGKERIARGEVWNVDQALDDALAQDADQAASELTDGGIFQKG